MCGSWLAGGNGESRGEPVSLIMFDLQGKRRSFCFPRSVGERLLQLAFRSFQAFSHSNLAHHIWKSYEGISGREQGSIRAGTGTDQVAIRRCNSLNGRWPGRPRRCLRSPEVQELRSKGLLVDNYNGHCSSAISGQGCASMARAPGCLRLPIECAHVRGGTDSGTTLKPPNRWCVSLCSRYR